MSGDHEIRNFYCSGYNGRLRDCEYIVLEAYSMGALLSVELSRMSQKCYDELLDRLELVFSPSDDGKGIEVYFGAYDKTLVYRFDDSVLEDNDKLSREIMLELFGLEGEGSLRRVLDRSNEVFEDSVDEYVAELNQTEVLKGGLK